MYRSSKVLIFIALFLCFSSCVKKEKIFIFQSAPKKGDEANNGGSLVAQKVREAYLKLDHYINLCLSSDQCKFNLPAEGEELLRAILEDLPNERKNIDQLQFENFDNFFVNGHIFSARTGDEVGDTIYINIDDLYHQKTHELAVTIHHIVALLIHEMGHHHGITDDYFLDKVAVEVKIFLDEHFKEYLIF